ncbi:MAG: non-ribosomal peptide synthetase, partial [Acidobacteriota bacterium]
GTQSTLDRLIAAQAAATPEGVALVVGDARLSYAELDARAGALARRLEAHGVGPDALVGIFLERNAWLPIAILGTLRAGAAYVPLDPVYPRQRLRFVIEDTRAPVVLTQSSLLDRLPEGDARALCLDRSGGAATDSGLPADRSAVASGPDDLAYVIYTSGSTGRPKGVAITHRSAVRLLAWARRQYSREQTAGLLAATSVCFDLSIFELFLPLVRGGKVILADSAFHLRALPAAGEVTLVNTVPSAITELARQSALPATVRTVNLAGEALHQSVVDATYDAGGVDAVYNLYGPSEDTTYSTWERVSPRAATSPSIGRPVDGTRAYLLDRQGRTVPVGVAGEIFLGGAGLARGYLGRPGATAARFLPDPFSDRTGSRLYQTGDSGRLRGDGRIDFLGRIDHQIKLRGFRIELGEIEAALSHQPGVEETVVVVRRTAGVDRLVAYIASQQTPPPSTADLTQALRRGLPDYMVPSIVVLLPELPRLPNGKIDRQHLPEPATQRPQLAASFVAPSTELGRQLAAIWQEVLGLDQVGLDDSFFELGGHSLLMAQVHDRLEKLVDRPIPIVELFQFPTLRALEKHLGGAAEAPPSFDAVRQRAARKRRLAPARRSRRSRSRPSR